MSKQIIVNSFSAIILAAGMSSRFGRPKCFLDFNTSATFLENLVHVYSEANTTDIVIVMNQETVKQAKELIKPLNKKSNITFIINQHPEEGRFSSVLLGAAEIHGNGGVFVQNIDNPFTNSTLLEKMKKLLRDNGYVVPVNNGKHGHPVLVSAAIMKDITGTINKDANLRNILLNYPCEELTTEDVTIHANINSEKEYRHYFTHEAIR